MTNVDMIPQPTPNLPLLRKVLDHIDAHPEEHNQTVWGFELRWGTVGQTLVKQNIATGHCGTAMCIAGWAMSLGAPELFDGVWAADDAAELLGLTDSEANDLFAASNSRAVIQTHAEQIAARASERL